MKNIATITIKNIKIGEGIPKIIVPIVGKIQNDITDEISYLKTINFDVIEWRADYYENIGNNESTFSILKKIRDAFVNTPLLFTFRTTNEGGNKPLSTKDYLQLNQFVIKSGLIDLIDIELFTGDEHVQEIVNFAHQHNIAVIGSNHDFTKTPQKNEIVARLIKMQQLGVDIPKIAVMPTCAKDVITLLSATEEMYSQHADRPIITISMSHLGMISRIGGAIFGSAMTFGIAKTASAPGQISIDKLSSALKLLEQD